MKDTEDTDELQFDFTDQPGRKKRAAFTFIDLDESRQMKAASRRQARQEAWDPTQPGTRFGEYQVTGLLGQGGAGQVLKGKHLKTGEPVAIKILKRRFDGKSKARERFRREAAAVSKAQHPNIIRAHAFGISNDRPFIVLELLEGGSVADMIDRYRRKQTQIPVERAVEITRMTLAALEAAHDKGLLHRDVKPDNLLLDKRGRVKLADFGLVKMLEETGQVGITVTGITVGTPFYMAPEQCLSAKDVTAQSDLYSVGVTLFELLTDELPFNMGRTPKALYALQSCGPAPRVRDVRSDVPKGIDEFVAKLLEFEARDRHPDARSARKALEAALPTANRVKVRLLQGRKEIHTGSLERGEKLVMGRAPEAAVTIGGKGLSRFHCQIELTSRGLVVVDLDSTNGTFVNGRRVREPTVLRSRDAIQLGKTTAVAIRWKPA